MTAVSIGLLVGRIAALALVAGPVLARDLAGPAELPPPSFKGQQYMDSRGCLFIRAGQGSQTVWIPRVSRQGVALCGKLGPDNNASSETKGGSATGQGMAAPVAPKPVAPAPGEPGGFLVAVGSFGRAANVEAATARVQGLGYGVVLGPARGFVRQMTVVLAGPFDSRAAAVEALGMLKAAGFADPMLIGP